MELFNPNHIGKAATPEGHVGQHARLFLPFFGYWFASGAQVTFLNSELEQKPSSVHRGLTLPDSFRKDASSCPTAVKHV